VNLGAGKREGIFSRKAREVLNSRLLTNGRGGAYFKKGERKGEEGNTATRRWRQPSLAEVICERRFFPG